MRRRLEELRLLRVTGADLADLDLKRRTLLVRLKRLKRITKKNMHAHRSKDDR